MGLLKSIGRVAVLSVIFYSLMFFGIACGRHIMNSDQHEEPSLPKEVVSLGDADYNWTLKTIDGKDFGLESARGKVILINIWGTWCPPCVAEMPSLQRLYNELKDEVVFVFASDEDSGTLSKFLSKNNYTLPVYIYTQKPLVYEALGVPMTFIISPDGKIVHKELGGPVDWSTKTTVDFLRSLKK